MTITIGLEVGFVEMLCGLIEFDFDAIEAYKEAVNRFRNEIYKQRFKEFEADHVRHTEELSHYLLAHGEEPTTGPSAKQLLTKGKIIIADLFGDDAILYAMKSNEEDTNLAYERAVEFIDKPHDVVDLLNRALADERRHYQWIEDAVLHMETMPAVML